VAPDAELTAWTDLVAHLDATGRAPVAFDDASGAGVAFRIARHACTARPVTFPGDKRWLALTVVLGRLPDLQLRGALLANTLLPVGAVAVWKEHAVLRQLLPLQRLPVTTLESTLRALVDAVVAMRTTHPYVLRDAT
jgi:hypothetical protein